MLLSEAIEVLAIATRADGRSKRTVQSYREKLSHLVAFLGDPPIDDVTTHDLRRFVAAQLDAELSPFTVAGRVRAFKRLFTWLVEEELLASNPAKRIRTPQPKPKKPKAIHWPDFVALLKTTEAGEVIDLRDRAIMCLLFDTACRVGGLCALKLADLDMERQRATVREKGDKTRLVFFTSRTAQALTDWLAVRPDDQGPWLFVSFGSRDRLSTRGVSHMLRRRAKRAGVEGPTNPHAFRHGFAKHFLLDGGDLGTLSDIMGHSDVSVTKAFYGVFTTEELQRKHDRHSPLAQLEGDSGENSDS